MAGPAKPKPPAAPPVAEPIKPKRAKPSKTLTLDEATERLASLEFEGLTEEDRLAAVLEIRERLEEQAHKTEAPAQALARRILLLRLWHELVQLRVVDVKKDLPPPFEPLHAERLFPPVEPGEGTEPSADEAPPSADHLEQALQPLAAKPFAPPEPTPDETLVNVKLLEAEMVRGMRLPAGIVVAVQPEDAEHLIASGKAVGV